MGRRSVWSDEKLIALAEKFVPVADEVYRLQRDDAAECKLFRRTMRGVETSSRGTMQGIYVSTAAGVRLAGRNSLNPALIRKMLEGALAKWERLTNEERFLPVGAGIEAGPRWEDSCPVDGLVLVRTARDLPKELDPAKPRIRPFNQDQVWFSKEEARGFLPAELLPGRRREVSRLIVERLARFCLVDNVKGQTIPYAPSEVLGSTMAVEVTAKNGHVVALRLTGETKAHSKKWILGDNYWKPGRDHDHGIETELLGRLSYDTEREAFVGFEVVAVGRRKGRTELNGRAMDWPGPIGFELSLAPQGVRIAPTFINVYGADWVKDPRND